jgi:spermidine/putrescine transport system permease protein
MMAEKQRGRLALMIGPPLLWLSAFMLAPLVILLAWSFRDGMEGDFAGDFRPTLDNYRTVFATPSYLELLGDSAVIALLVAVGATLLAYPLAYFLAFRVRERAFIYVVLLLIPFWISYLLRVMAWKLILGSNGLVNTFLMWTGGIDEPISLLFYSRFAVVITLIYVWTPFAALPIAAALYRIDRSLLEAAANLGASPMERFRRVTFPLSLPGVLSSAIMVFIPTVGEYVTPMLVGGSSGAMYGNIILDFFGKSINWPLGSALAVVMLAGILVLSAAGSRVARGSGPMAQGAESAPR